MKPYIPEDLPLKSIQWPLFIRLIGQANAALARYDGILHGIINPDILLSPLMTQEAVLSSRIEGTQATIEEVLEFEAAPEVETSRYEDIQEIINYRKAMFISIEELKKRPISLNMLLNMHSVLLDSVRGHNKGKGRFRNIQNWIGALGSLMENATYIPPEPQNLMDYLSNFEKYIHSDEEDRLVQLAIVHAQFELIHPFIDGNGRLGRIIVPIFLFEKGLLSSPMFYISSYLEQNRAEYYNKLRSISESSDWSGWISFFLTAIIEQAKNNSEKAISILALYERMKTEVARLTHSQYSIQTLDCLFDRPIFKSTDFPQRSKIPRASAMRIINSLKDNNILVALKPGRGRRAGIFMFKELIDIVEK
ncbi:MAG: Fic family protein [Nitrospirae bacterium]|nr:MAG: Fic family protein [Nitrospirota bacterium]